MREVFVFERFYRCALNENLISPLKISYFFQILFFIHILFCVEAAVIALQLKFNR